MKTRTLKHGNMARLRAFLLKYSGRLASARVPGFLTLLVIMSFCLTGSLMAQRTQNQTGNDTPYDGPTLFIPSSDVSSPNSVSSLDAARRNRPPEPTSTREDLFYPEGFLTLSKPTPEPTPTVVPNRTPSTIAETENKDKGVQLRPLDPSVETTPLTVNPSAEPERTPVRKGRDRFFFFAFSIALAGLGVFVYHELKYREQLRNDLVRNAHLCSPNATSDDFAAVLAADVDLTDPRAPSYANPHYDADVLLYGDPDHAGKKLSDPDFDDFRFEASESRMAHRGPGLSEENFDFMPDGKSPGSVVEPEEDFVVGGTLATISNPAPPSSPVK